MKKSFMLAILLMTVFMLQSCLKENDDFYPVVIGTTKIVDNDVNSAYFILDTGYKLSVNNINDLSLKDLQNNQRVFLQLKDVVEDNTKKELQGTIVMLVNIKTQDVEFTKDQASANELLENSDPVNIGEAYIVNGFLTLKYHYKSLHESGIHKFNLYAIEDVSTIDNTIYRLFLTHDASNDVDGPVRTLFMSFPIENIQEEIDSHEKTVITFKTYYSGNVDQTVYINKKK